MRNIVIIEENNSVRDEIKTILEKEGFVVHSSGSAEKGLDMISSILPDMIFCNIGVQDRDGFQIRNSLKNNPELSAIPFIILAPEASRNDIRVKLSFEKSFALILPCTRDELLEIIRKHLMRKEIISAKFIKEAGLADEELNNSLNFDKNTGLLRESLIEIWSEKHMNHKNQGSGYLLYLIRLDQIKNLIHSLGVHAGEYIQKTMAERFLNFAGENGILFKPDLCDFGIILGSNGLDDQRFFSDKIAELLSREILYQGLKLSIGGSAGYCSHDHESDSFGLMMNHAENALKQSMLQGANHPVQYSPSLNKISTLNENLKESLLKAVENNELYMVYQPILSFATDEITGAEALIRWNHLKYGSIQPAQFIPIAEETGMMIELGEWIYKRVESDLAILCKDHEHPPSILLNISSVQLEDESFLKMLSESIHKELFPADRLCLEISESMLMKNTRSLNKILHKIKNMGVGIVIDNFGTGFSSIAFLKQFPIDAIKVDRTLIRNHNNKMKKTALPSMVSITKKMNFNIIAECVENNMQKNILKDLGFHQYQGFAFGEPVKLKEFSEKYGMDKKLNKIVR